MVVRREGTVKPLRNSAASWEKTGGRDLSKTTKNGKGPENGAAQAGTIEEHWSF